MSGFFQPEVQKGAAEAWRDLTWFWRTGDTIALERAYRKALPACEGESGGKERLDLLFKFLREGGRLEVLKGTPS